MDLGNGPSSRVIVDSLKTRARQAFGRSAKGEFEVTGVQTHIADVSYNVKVQYSTQVSTTYHPGAYGQWNSRGAVDDALLARHQALMSAPGKAFREHMYQHLKSSERAITHPSSFRLVRDSETYSCIEYCFNCGGHGAEDCRRCGGRGIVSCSGCFGRKQVTCTNCIGGYVGGPPICPTCAGSRVHLGRQCGVCYGSGRLGRPCWACHTSCNVTCGTCGGTGDEHCSTCDHGKVTCSTCHGSCQLTYTSCLDVMVETSINYSWTGAPTWMSAAIKWAMNDSGIFSTVFSVKTIQRADQDDYRFIGKGKALGSSADVTYRGRKAQCHFIGTGATPVDLGGVLAGNFDVVLKHFDNPQSLRSVRKGSKGSIATTLIQEIEDGSKTVQTTTPVLSGIITVDQATAFIERRKAARDYINGFRFRFSLRAVCRYTFTLFWWLLLFYFVVNLLGKPSMNPTHGIFALFKQPQAMVEAFFRPYAVAMKHGGWTLWTFVAASLLFGSKVVPRVWEKASYWPSSLILRVMFLVASGSIGLSLLLALTPTTVFYFYPPGWVPSGPRLGAALAGTGLIGFKLISTALFLALVRYKAAGHCWANAKLRRLRMN